MEPLPANTGALWSSYRHGGVLACPKCASAIALAVAPLPHALYQLECTGCAWATGPFVAEADDVRRPTPGDFQRAKKELDEDEASFRAWLSRGKRRRKR